VSQAEWPADLAEGQNVQGAYCDPNYCFVALEIVEQNLDDLPVRIIEEKKCGEGKEQQQKEMELFCSFCLFHPQNDLERTNKRFFALPSLPPSCKSSNPSILRTKNSF
jgi:hypothetical protein